jgi:hypothetical protein
VLLTVEYSTTRALAMQCYLIVFIIVLYLNTFV